MPYVLYVRRIGRQINNIQEELNNFTAESYFNQNPKKEYIGLMDFALKEWYKEMGY